MAAATLLAPASDAELLALGRHFEASWAAERALSAEEDAALPCEAPLYDVLCEAAALKTKAIAERILEMRAATLPGLLLKARVASWCHSGRPIDEEWLVEAGWPEDDEPTTTDIRSVLSILRDLAALDGQPMPVGGVATVARAA